MNLSEALRPNPGIARFLLSTPSRIVGELQTDEMAISLASPVGTATTATDTSPNPYFRSYYVVSYVHEEWKETTILLPDYSEGVRNLTDLASVWYGKRFDLLGNLQQHGRFHFPILNIGSTPQFNRWPFNHTPRPDLSISLIWEAFWKPLNLLSEPNDYDHRYLTAAWKAVRFYARALRSFDQPEVAYLHLLVAAEVLASAIEFRDDQLFDDKDRRLFNNVREQLGPSAEKDLRQRFFQLRRKMAFASVELTNDSFFAGSESEFEQNRLTKANLERAVKAAYDIRSRFLHTGANLDPWLRYVARSHDEMQSGRPVIRDDPELAKTIARSPTLLGLERLVRFMTLRFIHTRIVNLNDRLDGEGTVASDSRGG